MKGYILLGLGLSLTILFLLIALIPSTDDFSPDNPLWNGLTTFRWEFNADVVSTEGLKDLPSEAVLLVVGPSLNLTTTDSLKLREFVEKGAVLIIADDFGSGNSLLEALGISTRILSGLLMDGVFMFRSPTLPRAIARINGSVFELYLNYASVIKPDGSGVCFAYSSPFSYLDINFNRVHDDEEPYGPFCVAYVESLGSGRVIVISDSSIFINSMLNLGGNSVVIKNLVGSRRVYILVGLWREGTYAYVRSLMMRFLNLTYGSSLRYVSIPLTGFLVYVISLIVYKRIRDFIKGK